MELPQTETRLKATRSLAYLGTPGLVGIVDVAGSGDTIGPRNVVDWNGDGVVLLNTFDASLVGGNSIGGGAVPSPEPNGNGVVLLGTQDTLVGGSTTSAENLVGPFGEGGIWVESSTSQDAKLLGDLGLSGRNSSNTVISGNDVSSNHEMPDGVTPPQSTLIETIKAQGVNNVAILSNSIYQNESGGILGGDQVPVPLVSNPLVNSGKLSVEVKVQQKSGVTERIQVFSNPSCSAADKDEGQSYLGDAVFTGKSTGDANETVKVKGPGKDGGITATLTEGATTSQFSECVPS
jgi:hypothetical protein